MKRTSVFLPEQMLLKLSELSKSSGMPVAELIRIAIADYLKKEAK